MDKLQVKVVNDKIGSEIPFPSFSTRGSAGMDLRACIDNQIEISARATELIPSGIAIYIEETDYAVLILPRSGLGHIIVFVLGNFVLMIYSV